MKKIVLYLMGMAVAFSVVACSPDEEDDEKKPSPSSPTVSGSIDDTHDTVTDQPAYAPVR
ncbi:MAG: hypothetical protein IJV33_09890 [Bacteroidaceae bacterium]|nr:hypothetical protein [Bacteroidaceae bacterium]